MNNWKKLTLTDIVKQFCLSTYEGEDCLTCYGKGEVQEGFDPSEYDTSVDGFICMTPEQQRSSLFCFSGDEKGVESLKAILPIIEECGCEWSWNQTGDQRIEISW